MQTPTTLPVHDGAGSDAGANNSDADYTDTQHASHDVDDVEAGYAHEQHGSGGMSIHPQDAQHHTQQQTTAHNNYQYMTPASGYSPYHPAHPPAVFPNAAPYAGDAGWQQQQQQQQLWQQQQHAMPPLGHAHAHAPPTPVPYAGGAGWQQQYQQQQQQQLWQQQQQQHAASAPGFSGAPSSWPMANGARNYSLPMACAPSMAAPSAAYYAPAPAYARDTAYPALQHAATTPCGAPVGAMGVASEQSLIAAMARKIEQLELDASQRKQGPPPSAKHTGREAAGNQCGACEDDADQQYEDGKPASIKPLSSAACTSLMKAADGLKPEKVAHWIKMVASRGAAHLSADLRSLWWRFYDPDSLAAPGAAIAFAEALDANPALVDIDTWAATAIYDSLDHSETRVVNLYRKCTAKQLASGHAILLALQQQRQIKVGATRRVNEEAYNEYEAFTPGMQPEDVEKNADHAITLFQCLPTYNPNDPWAERLALIRKLPASMKKKRDDLEDELFEAPVRNPNDDPWLSPWSKAALIELLAIALKGAPNPQGNFGNGGQGGPPKPSARKCFNCGKSGHTSRECNTKCPIGKCKNCPCCYPGGVCAFKSSTPPTSLKNSAGNELSGPPREKLLELHKKKFPQANAADGEEAATGAPAGPTASCAMAPGAAAPRLAAHTALVEDETLHPSHAATAPAPSDARIAAWKRTARQQKRANRAEASKREREQGIEERSAAAHAVAMERVSAVLANHRDALGDLSTTPFVRQPTSA